MISTFYFVTPEAGGGWGRRGRGAEMKEEGRGGAAAACFGREEERLRIEMPKKKK